MNRKLEEILDDSLAQVAAGRLTLEGCLERYPEHAAALGRLLPAAAQLARVRALQAPAPFKARARAQLVAHMRARPRQGFPAWLAGLQARPYRLAFALAAMAFVFLTAATAAAQTARPGDALYGWKLLSERTWRALQADPLAAELALAERRAEELALVAGTPAGVEARRRYQAILATLAAYDDPAAQATIYHSLTGHAQLLGQAGLLVPELDQLLLRLSPAAPTAAPTPALFPGVTPEPLLPAVTLPLPPGLPAVTPAATLPPLPLESAPTELLPELPPLLPPLTVPPLPPTVSPAVPLDGVAPPLP